MSEADADARGWLDAFERAVRERDYAAGRALFAPDAVGFGSVVARWVGLDQLDADQWRQVWPTIEAFTFERDALSVIGDAATIVIAAPWTSIGIDRDGGRFARPGRVTLVLRRDADAWRCHHSHYSLVPGRARR